MSDTGEQWQVARRSKGAARKSKSLQVSSTCSEGQHLDIQKTVKRIRDIMCELRCEEFWCEWKHHILEPSSSSICTTQPERREQQLEESGASPHLECVCYGLGSFSSCVAARYQLAMLLLLLDAAQIAVKDSSVYDPAFTSSEKEVLRELGLTVLAENEEGKRLATKPTLFYLMHCGKALYNNLLWKNWSTNRLPLVKIIGNSFTGMSERSIEREFKRDYSYISKAVEFCEERQLPCPSRLIDVFSDTSVITFPLNRLNGLPQSTWTGSPEPQYLHCSDLEIILKEKQNITTT